MTAVIAALREAGVEVSETPRGLKVKRTNGLHGIKVTTQRSLGSQENLERLKRKDAAATIRDGRIATQMPAFADKLTDADINALVDFLSPPVASNP